MKYSSVFKLIKTSLFDKGTVDIPASDIPLVFSEMKSQTIAALPFKWVKEHNLDDWTNFCYMSQARWIKVMHGQTEMLKIMNDNNIPCVIIKGAAAAMSYPNPSLRQMGDIDFLVKRCDYECAARVLEGNNFSLSHDKKPNQHHYGYHKDGISYELHRRLGIVSEKNEEMLSLFEKGIDNREIHVIEGFEFPTLPQALNGISLLYHINQHLRSGLGHRQIIDWMMFIDKLSDEIWKEELEPIISKTGMKKLAVTVTAMCQKYLGLRKNIEWCSLADESTVNELMNYILLKGNFGTKGGEKEKVSSVFLHVTGPIKLFKRLQDGGMSRWKAAKKHRILHPFAWIYQSGRITKELVKNRISPKGMLKQHRQGLNQRELIKKCQ